MAKKQTYSEQIQSPQWQRKRLEILNQRGFKCEKCGNDKEQLHIHHKEYKKGKSIWEYDNSELLVLCKTCHSKNHGIADNKYTLTPEEAAIIEHVRICYEIDKNIPFYLSSILWEYIKKYPSSNFIFNLFWADENGDFGKIVSDLNYMKKKQDEYEDLRKHSREIEDALGIEMAKNEKLKQNENG